MVKKSSYLFAVLFISLLACTNCSKKSSDTPAKTKTELIATGTWKFSSATVGGVNVSGELEDCQKDNIYTFVATGAGIADEGATKCNTGDAQTGNFTWSFQSGETLLVLSTTLFTGGSNTFTIVSLTSSQLTISQEVNVFGTMQTVIITLVH